MFSKTWETSKRKYNVIVQRDVKIPLRDGIELNVDLFRPDSDKKFPAILSMLPFALHDQSAPLKPAGVDVGPDRVILESGDPNFFVRRGYVHVIGNVRGSGKSGGTWPFEGPEEVRDWYDVIEWIAKQPWCSGNVGTFGNSYVAALPIGVAALNPPHLKCIFALHGGKERYRHNMYRGGILCWGLANSIARGSTGPRVESLTRKKFGDQYLKEAIAKALQNPDIVAVPELVAVLKNPDLGTNPLIVDVLAHPLYDTFWEEREVDYKATTVPAYVGSCWGNVGGHLPGAICTYENITSPKKMLIGPPMYLERPLYQPLYESLRWFDYWLKGIDNGIMDEPNVRVFVMGTSQWKEVDDWPIPGTKWTPFYLHENRLLSEHEFWPNEGQDSFEDSPYSRGYLQYNSPRLVEDTEVIGPIVLNLYASTTDIDIQWLVDLLHIDGEGNEKRLTRGWLKASHRELDPERFKPWQPWYTHKQEKPLTPGKIYEFNIPIVATGRLFKAGSKISLRIGCRDYEPRNRLDAGMGNNLLRHSASRITVYHNEDYPSHLILPITKGNILGTCISEGKPFIDYER